MATYELTKLRIPYEPPIDGFYGEHVWVSTLKNRKYRIENDPVCGFLKFHDIVTAFVEDGVLTYRALVMRAIPTIGD